MTRPSQVEEERRWLRFLQDHYPDLTGCAIEARRPPEPDFAAIGAGGLIGIEVTEFIGSRLLRHLEGEQDGIVQRAEALYQERSLPPVNVVVLWAPGYQLRKRDRTLAEQLASLVATHVPKVGGRTRLVQGSDDAPAAMPSAFDEVWVGREVEYEKSLWDSPRTWWVGSAGPEVIQREIDRKSDKPSAYREEYSERWLVLVHRGSTPSLNRPGYGGGWFS